SGRNSVYAYCGPDDGDALRGVSTSTLRAGAPEGVPLVLSWWWTDNKLCDRWSVSGGKSKDARSISASSHLVEALLGASIYGTIVVGILIVALAAVPRGGFKEIATFEEEQLYAAGFPSRRRNVPTRWCVRQIPPFTALSVAIIIDAVIAWW